MQYQIVCSNGDSMEKVLKIIEEEVNKLCQEGWRPQGGISIAVTDLEDFYASQAMVK